METVDEAALRSAMERAAAATRLTDFASICAVLDRSVADLPAALVIDHVCDLRPGSKTIDTVVERLAGEDIAASVKRLLGGSSATVAAAQVAAGLLARSRYDHPLARIAPSAICDVLTPANMEIAGRDLRRDGGWGLATAAAGGHALLLSRDDPLRDWAAGPVSREDSTMVVRVERADGALAALREGDTRLPWTMPLVAILWRDSARVPTNG